MVTGRTKGLTFRGSGNVVLIAAQRDDPDGNPTEEYVLLRADQFGRLRTDGGADPIMPNLFDVGGPNWTLPGWSLLSGLGSVLITQNKLFYVPIYVALVTTYVRIGVHVIAAEAATVVRLGYYAADLDSDNQLIPGALINDAGLIDSATTGEKTIVVAYTMQPGFYFLALSTDAAVVQLRGWNNATGPVTPVEIAINAEENYFCSVDVADGAAALSDPAREPTDLRPGALSSAVRVRT